MPTAGKSPVIPTMRYRDAPAAIDWLGRVLGFAPRLVVPGEDGTIAHAQLVLGDGMVMLGSARDDEYGRLIAVPGPGGTNTQSACLVVDDVEAVHQRALAAGAEIVTPLQSPEYGGTFFACRDPEGHVWNIGSYDPWAEAGG
ncbi:MAG: VOC family protein [Defluviicoccus sp.]|nr:VOC family protein [Defluviicoccus sp.]MDE0384769.1 VOC family protein [Defluviicoccus sp.]